MDNIAPAISAPSGMGENKPASQAVLDWVHEVELLTEPDNIFWCDGSEAENDYLLGEACRQEVVIKLNQEKAPGCYLHRSNPNDVARVEQFTLICTPTKEEAGPTNHWADPAETYRKLHGMLKGAMRGRTMFVVPYIMGPPESPLAKVGYEITDSIYVVLSMRIMTRMGAQASEKLGEKADAEFNRGVHSLLDLNPERRWICHFPQDNAQESARAERDQEGADDHADDMDHHEERRDMNRVTPHPGYRLVVIRDRDAEHSDSKRPCAGERKGAAFPALECAGSALRPPICSGIFFLGQAAEAVKLGVRLHAPAANLWITSLLPFQRPVAWVKINRPARPCSTGSMRSSC
jgi:hypothetical protein